MIEKRNSSENYSWENHTNFPETVEMKFMDQ